jgi:hypothetical protein
VLKRWKDYLKETTQAFNEPDTIIQEASNCYHLLISSCEICYGSSIAGMFMQVLVNGSIHFVLSHDLKLPTIIFPTLYLLRKLKNLI